MHQSKDPIGYFVVNGRNNFDGAIGGPAESLRRGDIFSAAQILTSSNFNLKGYSVSEIMSTAELTTKWGLVDMNCEIQLSHIPDI